MLIRLSDTQWVNLDNVREIKVKRFVNKGKVTDEFHVAVETNDYCYYTDVLPDKETAVLVAKGIAQELNKGAVNK